MSAHRSWSEIGSREFPSNGKSRDRRNSPRKVACAAAHAVEAIERRILLSAFTPTQIRQAYGVDSISLGGVTGDGTGQTIAIVCPYFNQKLTGIADTVNGTGSVEEFNQLYHLQPFNVPNGPTLTVLNQLGQTSPLPGSDPTPDNEWNDEEALDIEWAHAIAPQANIVLFAASSSGDFDLFTANQKAAQYDDVGGNVSVVSNSWSEAEPSASTESADDGTFVTPSGHQNVTFLAAAGDDAAGTAWSVSQSGYPSMSPNVISVGGTHLTTNPSTGAWSGESAWQITVDTNNRSHGAGGGVSQHETQPSYQTGQVNGASVANRTTPDISMDADPGSGMYIVDYANTSKSSPFVEGGTSFATPMWAGLIAIANQGRALLNSGTLSTSQALSSLYTLSPSYFHDVTVDPGGASNSNGYPAVSGYDLTAGRGSPIANLLVPALAGYSVGNHLAFAAPSPASSPTVTITAGTSALPTLTVDINNSSGSLITTDNSAVTMSVYDGQGTGVTLRGSVTVNAVGGLATFNNLWLTAPPMRSGTYQIMATDGADVEATFSIKVVPASPRSATISTLAWHTSTSANGNDAQGGLVMDASGNLYGTTNGGGTNGLGTIFEIDATNHQLSTLYSFDSASGDGYQPSCTLARDPSTGYLYGTTTTGGDGSGDGTVFRYRGGTNIDFVPLAAGSTGDNPDGAVVLGSSGIVYGTASGGGSGAGGTVFAVSSWTPGSSASAVVSFVTGSLGGWAPHGGLAIDGSGNLYGTTSKANSNGVTIPGTVFEVAGGTLNTLGYFLGSNGGTPNGTVTLDANGNIFGTTEAGGASGYGTVFEVVQNTKTITTLVSFDDGLTGNPSAPYGGVLLDRNGNLFGTSYRGGAVDDGALFEIAAGTFTVSRLDSFDGSAKGARPRANLFLDPDGNIYGTASGDAGSYATVFELASIANPAWLEPGSQATWTSTSTPQTLAVGISGTANSFANYAAAWVIANPHVSTFFNDLPLVTVSGGTSKTVLLRLLPTNGDNEIDLDRITLSSGGAATVGTTIVPDSLTIKLMDTSTAALTVNSGTTFDLNNSRLVVSYAGSSPVSTIYQAIQNGYSGGAWTGGTIVNSGVGVITTGAGAANSSHNTGIGYADSADGTGSNPNANSVLLKYTMYGDANLDATQDGHETVDIFDLNALLPHFNTSGNSWTAGDFTYNGNVDIFDLNLLLPNFNTSLDPRVSSAVSISGQTTFAVGGHPMWVAAADVNGDGKPDLVVDFPSAGEIGVLLGNGDGTFGAVHTFAAGGTMSEAIALSDLNGDGKLDVIASNLGSSSIAVLAGNGDGTFAAPVTFAAASPWAVAVADVNGDGKMDVVAGNLYGNAVDVLLGNGNGTFGAQQTFATGPMPYSVAVGDFNGDGRQDLAVTDGVEQKMSVLLGNGDGTFAARRTFTTEMVGTANTVAVGDVNGDGKSDLVVSNLSGTGSVSVLLGNGNGTFQSQVPYDTGNYTRDVKLADINGDGKLDLVAVNEYGHSVSVMLGNGDGTFQSEQTFGVGSRPWYAAVVDLNGDGKADIVVADYGGTVVSVLMGQ